jgi:hypothetical protein
MAQGKDVLSPQFPLIENGATINCPLLTMQYTLFLTIISTSQSFWIRPAGCVDCVIYIMCLLVIALLSDYQSLSGYQVSWNRSDMLCTYF